MAEAHVPCPPEPEQRPESPLARHMLTARTSRFSVLLEDSVDYAVYRTTYGRQFLQQQPKFDSLRDAETELECVLHDDAFAQQEAPTASAVMAENVALAIDWYISALVLLFDGDEPFQNPDFLRFCCLFFASPLYENNARLVQRHLVKRTYAELGASPADKYGDSLWILLAFMHLITDFQQDTYLLCKDSGLFPLLQHLILSTPERHLHVLAMSLMFEIAQAVPLSKPDLLCVSDEFLVYLLEYVEGMRYAESDMYNNTGTKLVVALNEQFLRPTSKLRAPQCNGAARIESSRSEGPGIGVPSPPLSTRSTGQQPPPSREAMYSPVCSQTAPRVSHHARTASACFPATSHSSVNKPEADATDCADQPPPQNQQQQQKHLTVRNLHDDDSHLLLRSRSMDFNALVHSQPAATAHDTHAEESQSTSYLHTQTTTTPVVAILARRTDRCKTFTENLVFLLNREAEPLTQTLILNMLACILATDSTSDILYTNDMHVLVDILIRDLSNLSEGIQQRLRQAYLRVVCALLRNRLFLAARHRLSDIELCLVNILRQSLICSQSSSLAVGAVSRRGSVSSTSTRHNSMVSADFSVLVSGGSGNGRGTHDAHRECSRAESPASSRSSVVSEETCCPRQTDDQVAQNQHQHQPRSQSIDVCPKAMRRPAPPPPPPPSSSPLRGSRPSSLCESRPLSASSYSTQHHGRRRRAPPPPPPLSSCSSPLRSSQLNTVNEGVAMDSPANGSTAHRPAPSRRKAPPPPPPPRSRPSSRGNYVPPVPQSPNSINQQHQAPAPPTILPRRGKAEPTGLRRQLSVKKSVTKYKLRSTRPPPPPPPVSLATTPVSAQHMEPMATGDNSLPGGDDHHIGMYPEGAAICVNGHHVNDSEDDLDDSASDAGSESAGPDDSVEERRITRKLVESALRSCHEARHFAVKRRYVAGPSRIEI
ncbi:pre-rRNA processing [Coemansia sp. RSA 1813]|nr:pre-rRNA processing [Coemansia sp. RSA 1646]KAJ1768979.1 pre-rRNA processing [Coemansia sp. RSA 1843]KAJ2212529.1 pre-rRNA processing [Coemansia sp. RSA 487]KAJ2566885.1 pre-rRNA processing [Coemansia sp. RSA 1813]